MLEAPKIIVLSRLQVRKFRCRDPYVVISIRSPGDKPVKLKPDAMRKARINLACIDGAPEWGHESTDAVLLSPLQANRLASLTARYRESCIIVINCEAGISRSAGVAVGIRTSLEFDASEFATAPYDPNPHVMRLVKAAVQAMRVNRDAESRAHEVSTRRPLHAKEDPQQSTGLINARERAYARGGAKDLIDLMRIFGLSATATGLLFSVRRRTIDRWLVHGVPLGRLADVGQVAEAARALYVYFRPEAIPQIVTEPIPSLGGRTVLEVAKHDPRHVVELVEATRSYAPPGA